MNIKSVTLMIICFVGNMLGSERIALAEDAISAQPQEVRKETQLANTASRFLEATRQGSVNPRLSTSLANRIWAEVQLKEAKSKVQSTPQSRRSFATHVLGSDVYQQMESYYLQSFKSSSNTVETLAALNMLGKALSSKKAETLIEKECRDSLQRLTDEDQTNDPRPDVLFALADSLCYLGNSTGIEVLASAIGSEKASARKKCSAIKALATLSTTNAHAVLQRFASDLLESDDSEVAYCALDTLAGGEDVGDKTIIDAAQKQLERLSRLVHKQELDRDDLGLLMKVSLVLRHAIEEDGLSVKQKELVKNAVKSFFLTGRRQEQERVVSLFSRLAENEDVDIIRDLLKAESPKIRTEGVRSLLHCDPAIQKRFLANLMSLLDDSNRYTRDLALYVIRRIRGERATNLLPEKEFQKEAARIKSWWIESGKKKYSASK